MTSPYPGLDSISPNNAPSPSAGEIPRDFQHRGLFLAVLGPRSAVGHMSAAGDVLCNGSVRRRCRAFVSSGDLTKHLKDPVNLVLASLCPSISISLFLFFCIAVPLTLHFLFFLLLGLCLRLYLSLPPCF